MDRYAVIMFHVPTATHELHDVYLGDGAVLAAVAHAISETTDDMRPIVLDVNDLMAEAGIALTDNIA